MAVSATAGTNGSCRKRYAVVTGANKGIGYEICRSLASHGITVVLTSRDEKRGVEAVQKLKESAGGHSDDDDNNLIIFHQLDVSNPSSIASLFQFINSQFGRLDILVNNAAVSGAIVDFDALRAELPDIIASEAAGIAADWTGITMETHKLAIECLETNYYGTRRMTEAFVPLLNISKSPRIVNISGSMGKLKKIPSEWAKGILNDTSNLTEQRIDEVIDKFLKDFKDGNLKINDWPLHFSAYTISKATINAYTRIAAQKYYPKFKINCVCPGSVQTDMTHGIGLFTAEQAAAAPVRLALLDDAPSGQFFLCNELSSFD